MQIDIDQRDVDDFKSYSAPVYQVVTTFNCIAASIVTTTDPSIRDVVIDSVSL